MDCQKVSPLLLPRPTQISQAKDSYSKMDLLPLACKPLSKEFAASSVELQELALEEEPSFVSLAAEAQTRIENLLCSVG